MEKKSYIPESWRKQWHKPMEFIYDYKPMRITEVSRHDWDVRRLIWSFKDGMTSEWCAQIVAKRLITRFAGRLHNVVFACIPASSEEKNAIRYKRFAEKVAELTGCINGYEAVRVEGSRLAIHEHREGKRIENTQTIELNREFFKGKEVIVFDDVLTLGKSYAKFACALEGIGASVIGGIFLGRTVSA